MEYITKTLAPSLSHSLLVVYHPELISAQFYIGACRGNIASCVKPGGHGPRRGAQPFAAAPAVPQFGG